MVCRDCERSGLESMGRYYQEDMGGFKKLYEIVAVVDLRLGDNVEVA